MSLFDQAPDRRGSDSVKWARYAGRDVLPLWVADMDFAAPPAVIEALRQRVEHGVFGYPRPWPSLTESVLAYLEERYGWSIEAEWLIWLPGLVTGLNLACRAAAGGILTATPVYPPFLSAPANAGLPLARVDLVLEDGRWTWDWAALEAACRPETRLLLLCHPHNPVGRCWDVDELQALAEFAARRDLLVCSDEIHCDLILDGRRHRPFATLGPGCAARSITLMAPSKTYNIPGLGCAFAVIPDAGLRRTFRRAMDGIVPHVNLFGLAACEAALRHGEDWHRELIAYLVGNRDRVQAAVKALPGLEMRPVEATYLAWIDARGLGEARPAAYLERFGIGLSEGAEFGAPGWVRLNFGCSRATLDMALARLAEGCGP
ncbi:MAG: PatB family C-S lyase [Azonexus sp.]|nr:putative C-S lyase [Betaproteobacteria bacterium]MBK8919455.1 putative C-S lyase [Betaproteobacteria bacterium]MBP6037411.1 PatB family C-S lyase [Azonexus sp.]MBP6907912.1 PatB family C-S lyase [Azonexus sp.]